MPKPIRLTASKSSRINKPSVGKKPALPLMPSDIAFLKDFDEKKSLRQARSKAQQEKLQDDGPAELEWQLQVSTIPDIVKSMRIVLDRMWAPIPEKGLGREGRGDVYHFRKSIPPLVRTTHLYAIYPDNSTYVDREIRTACEDGTVRRLVVNLVEGSDLLIESTHYYAILDEQVRKYEESLSKSEDEGSKVVTSAIVKALKIFKKLLIKNPTAISLSLSELEDVDLAKLRNNLLSLGFLTLQSGQMDSFVISVPNIGSYLRLVASSRKWIIRNLDKMSWKELLESTLQERWESNKTYWYDFKGCLLEWVLYDCFGGGWCEPFKTPVGRGWKLTGKKG
ncbi:Bifunctional purine biosynthesis protein purH [Sugiyamaella lignohabitans]|uniref:Bifunctional purine biosynthesis protein purH n=1 Tax=Sugiyamaella lignohabitans TaxID=796027 RepID=A0A167ETM2_9ASCO|nr:Bifunctional purine biosynthesis protein purH [Sugiyamaella lignohabitans]ANB14439.1 Bifunctional purine biosynthesis protein purH [Sugiyamaella lignohabitans]